MEGKMKHSKKLRQAIILPGLFLMFISLSWHCDNKEPTKPTEKPTSKTWEEVVEEMKADSVDVMPKVIRTTAIQYPESARKAGLVGTFTCYLRIDENGDVVDVIIKDSLSPDCDKAAIDALKTWKFTPAQYKGNVVAIWLTIPIELKMQKK
jgi:TonB family protein